MAQEYALTTELIDHRELVTWILVREEDGDLVAAYPFDGVDLAHGAILDDMQGDRLEVCGIENRIAAFRADARASLIGPEGRAGVMFPTDNMAQTHFPIPGDFPFLTWEPRKA